MSSQDPLLRLLQTADAAAETPPVADELPQRVHQRRANQAARSRRIAAATLAAGVVLLTSVFVGRSTQSTAGKSSSNLVIAASSKPDVAEIARLMAEANALSAEADSLQRQVNQQRGQDQLASDQARYLVASIQNNAESATDRAASIKICQGDFYWEVRQSGDSARAAYQAVLDGFPNSHWATVARERLNELSMN